MKFFGEKANGEKPLVINTVALNTAMRLHTNPLIFSKSTKKRLIFIITSE